jgi:hypothetical protein
VVGHSPVSRVREHVRDGTQAVGAPDDKVNKTPRAGPRVASLLDVPENEAEPGIWLEVEPTLGPDGQTVDLSWICDLAVATAGSDGATRHLTRGHISSAITLVNGRAAVQRLSAAGAPTPDLAVIIGTRVRNARARKLENGLPQLSKLEKRWRELGQSTATN